MKKTNAKTKKKTQDRKRRIPFYYSYNMRLVINCFVFVLLLISSVLFLIKAFSIEEAKVVNYSEHSNLDYNVYLKENTFYEEEYLPKNMLYVANLIDKIKVDFDYRFAIQEHVNMEFEYEVLGKLVIYDQNEDNIYFEKEYELLDSQKVKLTGKRKTIKETIEIDYEKYNEIASDFKTSYGLSTKNKLIVYFNVKKDISSNQEELLLNNSDNNMLLSIPLSEKSVEINLDYKNIKNNSKVVDTSKVVVDNLVYLVTSIISSIISLVFMLKTLKLLMFLQKKENIYDSYVRKLLNEYDRLIVKTKTPPIVTEADKEKIIIVEEFTELLDVRDNLKLPIMYYVVVEHQKCHFYINNQDKIYLTTIKKVDLEDKNEE